MLLDAARRTEPPAATTDGRAGFYHDLRGSFMRLLWLGDAPWRPSGWGTATATIVPRLAAHGHDIAVFPLIDQLGAVVSWRGITVLPALANPPDVALRAHIAHLQPDLVLVACNHRVLPPAILDGLPWVPLAAIEEDALAPSEVTLLHAAADRLALSRTSQRALAAAGLTAHYAPLGVDTTVFHPQPQAEARAHLGLPEAAFVAGLVGANNCHPSREAFGPAVEAFASFRQQHADALLILHTDAGAPGRLRLPVPSEPLLEVLARHDLRVGREVFLPDQYRLAIGGFTARDMARLYAACDVLLHVTISEGFALPIVEAQACGCPVIAGNWTSMRDTALVGWKVPAYERRVRRAGKAVFQEPVPAAITELLTLAYDARGDLDQRAAAVAAAQQFDADRVVREHWLPALNQIGVGRDEHRRPPRVAPPALTP